MRSFLSTLAYCLTIFFVMFIVIDGFSNLDEFLKRGNPAQIILLYYVYMIPIICIQVIPVAILVAILYTLGAMNRHNEIVAMRAGGISSYHILAPLLFIGFLLSVLIFLLNETVVPEANITSTAIMQGLIEKGRSDLSERSIDNVTLYGSNNRMIFAREFEVQTKTLYDVVILEDNPRLTAQTKWKAKKARYEDGGWILYEAVRYRMGRHGNIVDKPVFESRMPISLEEKPEAFIKEASKVEFMNTKQLRDYIDHLREASRKLIQRLSVDFHYKIAFPFLSLVVMLIGAPLAMRTGRGNAFVGIGTSLVIVLLYYGINSVCLAMGKGGYLPPVLAAWFSNLIFSLVGLYLIRKTA